MDTTDKKYWACKDIKEQVGSGYGQEAELFFVSLGDSLRNFKRGGT